jgi:hypothetical protein
MQGFVLEILLNVFHKPDFETKFATPGEIYSLSRSMMACSGRLLKKPLRERNGTHHD